MSVDRRSTPSVFRVRELELRVQTAEKRFLTVRSEARRVPTATAAGDPRRHQLED